MALTRISVTVPEAVLAAANSRARELDRSRSWLVVEALRRFLDTGAGHSAHTDARSAVSEHTLPRYITSDPGHLGEYRLSQLESDLDLSTDERVRAAERTAQVARLRRPRWERDRVLTFDRYEDYLDWDRWERSSPA